VYVPHCTPHQRWSSMPTHVTPPRPLGHQRHCQKVGPAPHRRRRRQLMPHITERPRSPPLTAKCSSNERIVKSNLDLTTMAAKSTAVTGGDAVAPWVPMGRAWGEETPHHCHPRARAQWAHRSQTVVGLGGAGGIGCGVKARVPPESPIGGESIVGHINCGHFPSQQAMCQF
jgi:hypothetical protein